MFYKRILFVYHTAYLNIVKWYGFTWYSVFHHTKESKRLKHFKHDSFLLLGKDNLIIETSFRLQSFLFSLTGKMFSSKVMTLIVQSDLYQNPRNMYK